LKYLYDVDDGENLYSFLGPHIYGQHTGLPLLILLYSTHAILCTLSWLEILTLIGLSSFFPLLDTTIITLADWYHDLAPDAQNEFFQTKTVP
jgi:hypothetical protein